MTTCLSGKDIGKKNQHNTNEVESYPNIQDLPYLDETGRPVQSWHPQAELRGRAEGTWAVPWTAVQFILSPWKSLFISYQDQGPIWSVRLTALNIHHSNQIIGRNLYPSKRGLLIWKRFISPVWWVSNLQATKPLPRFLWWSSSYIAKIQHQNDLLLFLPAGCKSHEDDQLLLNLPLLKRTAVHLRWMLVETLNCFSLPLWAMEAFFRCLFNTSRVPHWI